jgi:hypothetical protein
VLGKLVSRHTFNVEIRGFESRTPYHARVAQLDERFATNEEVMPVRSWSRVPGMRAKWSSRLPVTQESLASSSLVIPAKFSRIWASGLSHRPLKPVIEGSNPSILAKFRPSQLDRANQLTLSRRWPDSNVAG